jgi:lysophospholipase L1-like esterase
VTDVVSSPSRRPRLVAAGLAAIVLIASVWALVRWRPWRDELPPFPVAERVDGAVRPLGAVVVVGDSLTASEPDDLLAALAAAGWGPIRIDAQPGRRAADDEPYARSGRTTIERIAEATERGPAARTWVIALGTNDLGVLGDRDRGPSPDPDRVIDAVLAAIPSGPDGAPDVWWVDVHAATDLDATQRFNDALQRAADAGRLTVVAWSGEVRQHPTWLDPDGIHTTDEGARARNGLIARTIG